MQSSRRGEKDMIDTIGSDKIESIILFCRLGLFTHRIQKQLAHTNKHVTFVLMRFAGSYWYFLCLSLAHSHSLWNE